MTYTEELLDLKRAYRAGDAVAGRWALNDLKPNPSGLQWEWDPECDVACWWLVHRWGAGQRQTLGKVDFRLGQWGATYFGTDVLDMRDDLLCAGTLHHCAHALIKAVRT